jgi:hypothetical protein
MWCYQIVELRSPGTIQNTVKRYGILFGYLKPSDSVKSQQNRILNKATMKTSNLVSILVLKFHHITYIIMNAVGNSGQSASWVKCKCFRALSGRTDSEWWLAVFCQPSQLGRNICIVNTHIYKSTGQDISVSIATCHRLDSPGIQSQWGGQAFPCPCRPALGPTQPTNTIFHIHADRP